MEPDLGGLWVEYAQLDNLPGMGVRRDLCTESACRWFTAWGFGCIEARILSCLFLKSRGFGHLQWDVGFDAGDEGQAAKVRAVLGDLVECGFVLDGQELRITEEWRTIFLVINPRDEQQLRRLGMKNPAELLSRCRIKK